MEIEPSSFKDPCAFVYIENGNLFRRFSKNYIPVYQKFINSGLYERLIKENLIIPHEEISSDTIKPKKVFISYPWEWCFSQLKDAALAVLKIQNIALDYDMTLKDANCFNMQFYNNKPVLIDTSSFENYTEGEPWTPYKQFCENFLAPLALAAYKDICLSSLLLLNINGIPLELASKLLPLSSKFNLNLFTHIHLHSRLQNKYSDKTKQINKMFISKLQLKSIIDNLIKSVENIKLKNAATQWENYYTFTNYEEKSFQLKKNIINNYKNIIRPEFVLDFGSNTGVFSRIFSEENIKVLDTFPADNQFADNEYVLTESGLYFQLVDEGTGTDTVAYNDKVIIRYKRWQLSAHSDTTSYWTTDESAYPLTFQYGVSSDYSCEAWQEAVGYMKRNNSHAKLIVESKLGFSDDENSVTPYAYEIKIKIQKN